MKISLLIPTIKSHTKFLTWLKAELWSQMLPYPGEIEIIEDDDEDANVGLKRNRLLERATGEYLAFIDADDFIGQTYIQRMIECADGGYDCASLKGLYSVDGVHDGIFEHSLKYDEWKTTNNEIKYERFPNHLNCIKSNIAKKFKFPEKSYGEDFDWSTQIHESGLLKTEYYIEEVIYFYRFISKK